MFSLDECAMVKIKDDDVTPAVSHDGVRSSSPSEDKKKAKNAHETFRNFLL